MNIPISDFEEEILNKVIHTHTFGEYHDLETSLHNLVGNDKENLIRERMTTEENFKAFQATTVSHILQFLLHNEFIWVREGNVHFLTHRGEELRRQGTLEKYLAWEEVHDKQVLEDLHTIETRGYLERDQVPVHEEIEEIKKEERRKPYNKFLPVYILIIIIIIVLCWIGRTHLFS